MSITIPKIGSGLPGAAEVEPPATVVRQAGGSIAAANMPGLADVQTRLASMVKHCRMDVAYGNFSHPVAVMFNDVRSLLRTVEPARAAAPICDDITCTGEPCIVRSEAQTEPVGMGVTGNAILLLGYVGGCLLGAPDAFYAVEDADPLTGTMQVRRHGTDNTYQISVVQLEGIE